MADDSVPIIDFLSHTERTKSLRDLFVKTFNELPAFFVRVPGRVNLIGEHVDYCGYPVLPMAIEQDVLLAVSGKLGEVTHFVNVCTDYEEFTAENWELKRVPGVEPKWYEYLMCGIIGAASKILHTKDIKGIKIAVSGTIPPAAGLSSSSALVCSAALAYVHANGGPISKLKLATICAESEKLIGTAGGGMDQAIAFLSQEGCGSHISWNPLTVESVNLPKDAIFVVAHSLVEANKASSLNFNDRVKSCELAAYLIGLLYHIERDNNPLTLSELQSKLAINLVQMRERCEKLDDSFMELKIKSRAIHVIEEAIRVERFRNICDNIGKHEDWAIELGKLIRESHRSLANLYECSHPDVDKLVKLSDEFGVYARLTGAGWGGCIVALCTTETVQPYVDMLKERYYSKKNLKGKCVDDLVFITSPNRGACIYKSLHPQQTQVVDGNNVTNLD